VARELKGKTRQLLAELEAARTRQGAMASLARLLALAEKKSYWSDFETLLTSSEFDDSRFARHLPWRLKVDLVESLPGWASPELCWRLYAALTRCSADEQCAETRLHLSERLCRSGRAFAIDFARDVLAGGDAELRRTVLRGLVVAQYADSPVDPEFGEGAAAILEGELSQASTDERESWLAAIRVFSPEHWQRLAASAPATAPPVWDAECYRIRGLTGGWGDYGAVLFHGLGHLEERGRRLEVERTGPFVPPVTVPGGLAIVVTDQVRRELADPNLDFRPVVLRKVVLLNWHEWDLRYPHPAHYPPGGEPENYILRRKDRPALHEKIGPLWLVIEEAACRPHGGDLTVVSAAVARRLYEVALGWIACEPIGA
jgi:hypothetical protein